MSKKRIVFQGEPGANSHIACRKAYPSYQAVPCATFEDAFAAVKGGRGRSRDDSDREFGRRPGRRHSPPDADLGLAHRRANISRRSATSSWRRRARRSRTIKTVQSHIHALGQCRKVIRKLGLKTVIGADTAGSAREIAEAKDKTRAAIASRLAANIYELEILRENIEDEKHNTTRFIVLSRKAKWAPHDSRKVVTTFVFEVRNIPAALYKALGGFATNGINMTKLESYMVERQLRGHAILRRRGRPSDGARPRARAR